MQVCTVFAKTSTAFYGTMVLGVLGPAGSASVNAALACVISPLPSANSPACFVLLCWHVIVMFVRGVCIWSGRYEAERIGMGQGELHAAKENFRTLLNMVVGLASAEVYAMGTRRGKPSFFFTVTIAFALVHLAATLGWTAKERGAKYD